MKKSRLIIRLAVVTLIALALAWFWALAPMLTPLLYLHPTDWTDADLVRHVWHRRLVQPEWVSTPPDYLRWAQAETLARLGVVFLGWFCSTALLIRRPGRLTRMSIRYSPIVLFGVFVALVALVYLASYGPANSLVRSGVLSGRRVDTFYAVIQAKVRYDVILPLWTKLDTRQV